MTPRGYDHFMLHTEAGRNLKLCRLTPAERCAWTFGVLAIAAKSPVRGAFMVGDVAGDANDVALQATVPKAVAVSTLRKARTLGMLEPDEDLGAEWIHDFEEHNPEPKRDSTSPQRSKRYRDRQKAKRHGVTDRDDTPASRRDGHGSHGAVTPPEEEGEEKNTPRPPEGEWSEPPSRPAGKRGRDTAVYDAQVAAYAAALFPDAVEPHRTQDVAVALGYLDDSSRGFERTNDSVRRLVSNIAEHGTPFPRPEAA